MIASLTNCRKQRIMARGSKTRRATAARGGKIARLTMWSRRGNLFTQAPDYRRASNHFRRSLLDGEGIDLDERGRASFN